MYKSRHNHDRDEILGMNITMNAIKSCMDILDCMKAEEIRSVTIDEEHMSMLSDYV